MQLVSCVLLALAAQAIAFPSQPMKQNERREHTVAGRSIVGPIRPTPGSSDVLLRRQIAPKAILESVLTTRPSTTKTTTTTRSSTTSSKTSTSTTKTTTKSTTASTTKSTTKSTTTSTRTSARTSTTTSRTSNSRPASTVDALLSSATNIRLTTTTSARTTTTSARTTTSSPRITTSTTRPTTTSSKTTTTTTKSAAPAVRTLDVTGMTYQNAMLTVHNIHRANHSLPNLNWNPALAATALKIALSCQYGHNVTVDGGGYGQNIGAGAPGTQATGLITNLMYNGEINYYPGPYGADDVDLTNFHIWGHYTQLVWADTTDVGCVTQYCPKGLGNTGPGVAPYFTVCNYSPPGNYIGEFSAVAAPGGGQTVVVTGGS